MNDLMITLPLLVSAILVCSMILAAAMGWSSETDSDPLLDLMTPLHGPDYTWIGPAHECLCGCNLFHALVSFDDSEITYYVLEGICYSCGGKVTLPCPLDITREGHDA